MHQTIRVCPNKQENQKNLRETKSSQTAPLVVYSSFLFLSRPIHRCLSASEFPEAKIPFSFLNPFVFSQALNDCRAATKEGRKRLGLTGFGLSQSFAVFKENTSRTTRSLGKLAREYNVTRVLQATRINTVCRQFSLSLSPLSLAFSRRSNCIGLYRTTLIASQRLTIHNPLPLPILPLIASVSLPSDTNRKRAKRNRIELPSAKSIDIPCSHVVLDILARQDRYS